MKVNRKSGTFLMVSSFPMQEEQVDVKHIIKKLLKACYRPQERSSMAFAALRIWLSTIHNTFIGGRVTVYVTNC